MHNNNGSKLVLVKLTVQLQVNTVLFVELTV